MLKLSETFRNFPNPIPATMAAGGPGRSVELLLGKGGSALSPLYLFQVANRLAPMSIDGHVSAPEPSNSDPEFFFSIPDYLSGEEARASVHVFLHKFKLSPCSARLRCEEVDRIHDVVDIRRYSVVSSDNLDYSTAIFVAICALLDHRSSTLASVVDVVAALACEALGADVSAFDWTDSGYGLKDVVSVASDFKIFFNGSKFVQDGKLVDTSVSGIPAIHGSFRRFCRLLHSWTCAQLKSPFRAGAGTVTYSSMLVGFSSALFQLAELSCHRAELLADLITVGGVCLEKLRPVDCNCIKETHLASRDALNREDYVMFSHTILSLLEDVRKAVCWEATLAVVLLDDSSRAFFVASNDGTVPASGDDKKKDKKAMGQGTASFMQFIKETMLDGEINESSQPFPLLEKRTRDSLSFFNPVRSEFDSLQNMVKAIVETRLPKLPKGTRDFANEQMALKERIFSIIVNVFKRHGATCLDTPTFEMRETFTGKYGEESKFICDLADQGGELCSLRYDLTVPFARFVAMNGLKLFKRYQIGKSYRMDNPAEGRYREIHQCAFDIAGKCEKMGPDFEVIKILTELLNELNIGDYEVKLNHRKLIDGMMAICGVPQEKFRTICSSIDKLDKQSFDQIKKEMVNEKGLSEETADAIGTFVKEKGSPMDLIIKLKQRFRENAESLLALNELAILFKALQTARCDRKVVFDLSLARGLDCYTGVIFEAVFKGTNQVGSIGAGGRYDNLIELFGGKQIPAVGLSLDMERVFAIMEQLHKDRNESIRATETEVLVSILGDDLSVAAELVSELWDAHVKAEYMVHNKLMEHYKRAKDSRIPWMVIVRESELQEGNVKLIDLVAEVGIGVSRSTFVEELCARLKM